MPESPRKQGQTKILALSSDNLEICFQEVPIELNKSAGQTGNFRVIQFSRIFAVSINPRKLKSAK